MPRTVMSSQWACLLSNYQECMWLRVYFILYFYTSFFWLILDWRFSFRFCTDIWLLIHRFLFLLSYVLFTISNAFYSPFFPIRFPQMLYFILCFYWYPLISPWIFKNYSNYFYPRLFPTKPCPSMGFLPLVAYTFYFTLFLITLLFRHI